MYTILRWRPVQQIIINCPLAPSIHCCIIILLLYTPLQYNNHLWFLYFGIHTYICIHCTRIPYLPNAQYNVSIIVPKPNRIKGLRIVQIFTEYRAGLWVLTGFYHKRKMCKGTILNDIDFCSKTCSIRYAGWINKLRITRCHTFGCYVIKMNTTYQSA